MRLDLSEDGSSETMYDEGDLNLGPDLQKLLRQSYDYLTIMP